MFKTIATAVGTGLRALGRAIPHLLVDAIGLCGVGLVSFGAWSIYPPAGYITGGALLLAGAVLLGARSARRDG